jgi:sugar phosphate permease
MQRTFSSRYKIMVLLAIAIARVIYSLNWFTLSPGLYQVESGFHASLQSLGVLESAFLLGAGAFQIPAAYAAAKWNAKLLVVTGLAVIAAANGLGSFASSVVILTFFRFLLGVGAAMFFSPAIVIVTPLFRNERQGLALGIYNSAFNIGGAIALLGWAYVVERYSWRIGLLSGAVLAAVATTVLVFAIRHTEKDFGQISTEPELAVVNVLKNKQIWFLGLGIIGVWSASYAISQFLPLFETKINLLDPATSSLLASLILVAPIPGSLIGGWLSDKARNRKAFLLYPTIAFGIGTALIGIAGLNESLLLIPLLGILQSFSFVSMYASPFQMEDLGVEQKAISISLMNSVQILGAFILPIMFTVVAASYDYTNAWLVVGLFTLVFVPFLMMFKEPFKRIAKISV